MQKRDQGAPTGTGEAGPAAALGCRAAGQSVAVVDSLPYGGTCGLRGCDPKKVLVGAAEIIDRRRRMEGCGITGDLRIDWPELIRLKSTFTDPFPAQREEGFTRAGVETFHGAVRFTGPRSVQAGDDTLDAARVVVAVGAWPAAPGIPGESNLTRSDEFLDLTTLPQRIVFVGGGYIAFEFGHIAARAGAAVTIVHQGARPLEHFDNDLVARLVERSRDVGIDIRTGAKVVAIDGTPGALKVTAETSSARPAFEADMVVHAAGRAPQVDNLDLPAAGAQFDRHGMAVNGYLQSVSNPAVYAAGDAANSGSLPDTPFAQYEGDLAARNVIEGNQHTAEYSGMASVVYSIPPLGAVGMTEDQARAKGLDFAVKQGDTSGWCHRAGAWWRRRHRDQRRRKARRVRVISLAVYCLARRSMRAVLAMVSLIAAVRDGQGCPGRAGTGASPGGMRSSAPLMSSSPLPSWPSWPGPAGAPGSCTAVSLLFAVTHQATRHGRPGFHRRNSATPAETSHSALPAWHAGSIPTAASPALNVKPRLYYLCGGS